MNTRKKTTIITYTGAHKLPQVYNWWHTYTIAYNFWDSTYFYWDILRQFSYPQESTMFVIDLLYVENEQQ